MRDAQRLSIGLGCILAFGACSNAPATTPNPITTPPPVGTAGTGATPGGTAGKPAAGSGAAGSTTTTGAAGSTAAGSPAVAGSPGTAGGGAVAGAAPGAAGSGAAGTPGAAGGGAPSAGYRTCEGKTSLEGECKAVIPGVYAVKTDVDVWWRDELNNPTIYDPGRGKITVFFREEIQGLCQDGTDGTATVQACGDILPPILAQANCGVLQIVFPDAMWDQPMMPKFKAPANSGFAAGGVWNTVKSIGLVGIELMTPDSPWPTYMESTKFACPSGTGEKCFPDHDGDGNPGITVVLKQDGTPGPQPYDCITPWEYMTAPLSALGALDKGAGATDTYIGLRTKIGGSATLAAGCGLTPANAEADGFESRLINCKLKNGMRCDDAGANFVDQNLPNYHVLAAGAVPPAEWKHVLPEADAKLDRTPSVGPRSSVVRLGDIGTAATCAQIRGTTFPQ